MKRILRFLLAFFFLSALHTASADDDAPNACPSPIPPIPIGLDPSKINLAIYNNLPGIQPPTLDLDGRDLSAEGVSMLTAEVLQLCSHPVIGWQDAPAGIFGLWFIQVAAI
jgi:hypothetical protein